MIASGNVHATWAGAKILERGGNATDAGVAAGICLAVTQPDLVSFAGVAPIMMYSEAKPRGCHNRRAGSVAPSREH